MADRRDTDPTAMKGRTEPGVGGPMPQSGRAPVAKAWPAPYEPPNSDGGPVDFDALHAALGANHEATRRRPDVAEVELEVEPEVELGGELEVEPEVELGGELDGQLDGDLDAELEVDVPRVGESMGASNATYASTRPHTVPPTYAPASDAAVPAVIVEADTFPGLPPQVTVPLGAGVPPSGPYGAPPASSSGPYAAALPAPSSGPYAAASPGAFIVQRAPRRETVAMPQRPRRQKSQTVVVRPRGPSGLQKLGAFLGMLVLVTLCGLAVIFWRKPAWLGFEAARAPAGLRLVPALPMQPATDLLAAPAASAASRATATAPTLATAPAQKKALVKPQHSGR